MGKELDLDDVCAGNPLAKRQLAELRAEVATPVLVATNRLADALADARAEIAKLHAERDEWQTRAEQYETAWVNENAANCELTDAITKLRAEREELIKAGNVMRRFIMTWRDRLDGVQMSKASFIRDCGIDRWNRALAEKGE